jgi:uncharacterized membrane protein YedE/YeeE
MSRRSFAAVAGLAGLALAGALAVGAFLLIGNANYALTNVREQLALEKIEFKAADRFTDNERAFTNARTGCALGYAGQEVTTGAQAACFANEYMLGHLLDPERSNKGLSFAEWGDIQSGLRAQIATAKESGDDATVAALEEELAATQAPRDTAFRGSMLRNALLTAFGFSTLAEQALLAGIGLVAGALVLTLLGVVSLGYVLATRERRALVPRTRPAPA